MTVHTPINKKKPAFDNMVRVENQNNLREIIARSVKLSRLYQTLDAFLKQKNSRTAFPFHLDPESVLNLYKQDSRLSY